MTVVCGLMSGTSLDGVDVAIVDLEVDGDVLAAELLHRDTAPFPEDLGARLRAVSTGADTGSASRREVGAAAWCGVHVDLGRFLGEVASTATDAVDVPVDLVASHGHTVHHDVVDGAVTGTLQVGQPAAIAETVGCPVVADLRARDVAAGGQGAPLVARVDELLLADHTEPVAALNLGGIANLTVVAPDRATLAFDVGPANALLDLAVAEATAGRETFDRDGRRAAAGQVHEQLRDRLLADPYLVRPAPKTTGKERYGRAFLAATTDGIDPSLPDLLATLVDVVAESVTAALAAHRVQRAWASGGGVANPVLWATLVERCASVGVELDTTDRLGVPTDAKEAIAFAVLGWLTLHGLAGNVPDATGAAGPRLLGSLTPGDGPLELPDPLPPPRRLVLVEPRPQNS